MSKCRTQIRACDNAKCISLWFGVILYDDITAVKLAMIAGAQLIGGNWISELAAVSMEVWISVHKRQSTNS